MTNRFHFFAFEINLRRYTKASLVVNFLGPAHQQAVGQCRLIAS